MWEIRRIGKQPTTRFDNNVWLIIHLVTASYLRWRESGAKVGAKTDLAAFDFADRRLTQTKPETKTVSAAIGIQGRRSDGARPPRHRRLRLHFQSIQTRTDCAKPLQRVRNTDNETSYYAAFQTSEKLLADRCLPCLLRKKLAQIIERARGNVAETRLTRIPH